MKNLLKSLIIIVFLFCCMGLNIPKYRNYPTTFQFSKITIETIDHKRISKPIYGQFYYTNNKIFIEINGKVCITYTRKGRGEYVKYEKNSDAYLYKIMKNNKEYLLYEILNDHKTIGYHLETPEGLKEDYYK
jgi:hypothetical protein